MKKFLVILVLDFSLFGCESTILDEISDTKTISSNTNLTNPLIATALKSWTKNATFKNQELALILSSHTDISYEQALGGMASLLALADGNLNDSQIMN